MGRSSGTADLRASERWARQSEEVLVVANRLEQLVVGNAAPGEGWGVVGLTDRIDALGGTITVHSPAGQGTRLHIDLPIHRGDRASS